MLQTYIESTIVNNSHHFLGLVFSAIFWQDELASGTARAVVVHRDAVTGVDRIFALQGQRGVVSGVYDPQCSAAGKVLWDKEPETLGLIQQILLFGYSYLLFG